MTLTTEQTTILERAKALVDANPHDATATMEIVRGLVGIVEAQAESHYATLSTIKDDIDLGISKGFITPNWIVEIDAYVDDCLFMLEHSGVGKH